MKAHAQPIVLIVRAGKDFNMYGDIHEFSCNVIIFRNEAYIQGATGKFSKSTMQAIAEELQKFGIEKVTWERKKKEYRKVEVDI